LYISVLNVAFQQLYCLIISN